MLTLFHNYCAKIAATVCLGTLLAACAPSPEFAPTPTKTPHPAFAITAATQVPPTATDLPTLIPPTDTAVPPTTTTAPPPATLTPTTSVTPARTPTNVEATATPAHGQGELLAEAHYWLRRPIGSDHRDWLDRTYAYGATAGGRFRPHTGVEFFNPAGTPVLAAADGTVYYAGTDADTLLGPEPYFYGNVIVLEHGHLSVDGQPLYTLYGHLSQIDVEAGQPVAVGDTIGLVGGTGIANGGAHLHFEVRVGDPLNYEASSRNPDLWIAPYYGYGTLAGRITGPDGALLPEVSITIRGEDRTRYTWTYASAENHPDPVIGENFTYGDLPEGWYTVTTASATGKVYRANVYIEDGRTTWLAFTFEE